MQVDLAARDKGLAQFVAMVHALGAKGQTEVVRGLNEGGDRVKTLVTRSLARQTGAGTQSVRKALKDSRRARGGGFVGPNGLQYEIVAKGAFLPLMAFSARQTSGGVSAAPWGERRTFPHTFLATMKSGHQGVFTRIAGSRMRDKPKEQIRELWGPAIPVEMIKGETLEAFDRSIDTIVLPKIMTRIGRVLNS